HWKKFAHDNGIPLASPAEEAEEQLRQTVERLRRDATRPEDVANRPRADGTVPPPPFPRKTAQ
ncbi:MAG TPA: hypothetical protein VJ867_09395, partial [Gemmatimonadaceae bacterium]|nr:hypothetical protein [Gemmatimonadaceae bacterium]